MNGCNCFGMMEQLQIVEDTWKEKWMIKVQIGEQMRNYPDGIRYIDIARELQSDYAHQIVLATDDGKLRELHRRVDEYKKGDTIHHLRFVTTGETEGMRSYRRGVIFLFLKAFYDVVGEEQIEKVVIDFVMNNGVFCKVYGAVSLEDSLLQQVKERMQEMVEACIPLEKRNETIEQALEIFHRHGMYDKEKLFRYRRVSRVNIYKLNEFEDYFYGDMVPDTSYLKYFDLCLYQDGLVILCPSEQEPEVVAPFRPIQKIFQVMQESALLQQGLEVDTVGALNDCIAKGNMNELILVHEALMEKKIGEIAEGILREKKQIVLIAGPSSSGKTTFSHRLSIQLRANGRKPHPIAVDNYFVDREKSPRDEFGNYNYEELECIDVELLNAHLRGLLAGEPISLPTYNFTTGKREFRGDTLQIGPDDILVLEGIHALNNQMTPDISSDDKFKIYISALNQLNIDEHNRIPTTDGRLLRRMVRDARTRNITASETINKWYSVRRGEEKNIFPYQEEADAVFNSSLLYELSVLKPYVEPLLFGITPEDPGYLEAKRLLKFLDYFLGTSSEDIPKNSIVREFIGGSCFNV